jgi:L-threonylcarbamoyladenylate synthase
MFNQKQLDLTVGLVKAGGVIAYPTESVFGLGCDPFNEKAVLKLLSLKRRTVDQGLILIASNIGQILPLIQPQHANDLARALKTWPGHFTWVFPKSKCVPSWVSGKHNTIAIRVSNHPIVKRLCDQLNHPLVSTSANISNQEDLNSIKRIRETFGDKIDFYIEAPTGNEQQASPIRDAHTLKTIR